MSVLTGAEGKLFRIIMGSTVSGPERADSVTGNADLDASVSIAAHTWYFLRKRGTGSSLSGNLPIDGIGRAESDISLVQGDKVDPFTLVMLGSVRDVNLDSSKEKYDITTQASRGNHYLMSDVIEHSGSIEGFFDPNDDFIVDLVKQFNDVLDGSSFSSARYTKPSGEPFHFMLKRNRAQNEKSVWHYMPMVIDSLNASKPMGDVQSVSINYTLDSASFPHTIMITNLGG